MLEVTQLRCFVAVAEELHFGRAAKRLNMTQPPLSRQIQTLEHVMNCTLFHRNSRSVRLSSAGQTFYPEARRVLKIIEQATVSAQEVAAGRRGLVRCGFTASSAYAFLPSFVSRMRLRLPEASISLSEMVSRDQILALDSGEIEVGILRPIKELGKFKKMRVAKEEMVVALPKGHPLTEKAVLDWSDCHRQRYLGYEQRQGRYFHDLVGRKLADEGVEPDTIQSLAQIHSILALVRSGTGIAIVPNSASTLFSQDVEYRPIRSGNALTTELYVVWQPQAENPLIPEIAEVAKANQ